MTTRLVCRSAPLPDPELPEQIAQLNRDEGPEQWTGIDAEALARLMKWEQWRGRGEAADAWKPTIRAVVALPEEADVGQCWSEEVFSMLEGER